VGAKVQRSITPKGELEPWVAKVNNVAKQVKRLRIYFNKTYSFHFRQIADGGTIQSVDIKHGEVKNADIATNAVSGSKIKTDAVGASEIKSGAVGSLEISTIIRRC
jgi:hypothetical protein